ncbi:MAG: hypothetical protein WCF21_08650, partial [Nitrososphaeraceae archaeon]
PTILTKSLSVIIPTGTIPLIVCFTITKHPTLLSYMLLQADLIVELTFDVMTFFVINLEIGDE